MALEKLKLAAIRARTRAIERSAAGPAVHFLPFSDAMPEFYSALDVFAFPTLQSEGLSRALIESMACAVPSVATPLGGYRHDKLKDTRTLVAGPFFRHQAPGRSMVGLLPLAAVTTLGPLRTGGKVNLETDILAKYVQRLIEARGWE